MRGNHFIAYRFRVRDSRQDPWRMAKEKMTLEHVRLVYGEGNYEKVDGTQDVLPEPELSHLLKRRASQEI